MNFKSLCKSGTKLRKIVNSSNNFMNPSELKQNIIYILYVCLNIIKYLIHLLNNLLINIILKNLK